MHGQISQQIPCSETPKDGVYVPSPPRTEEPLEVSQHMGSVEMSKQRDLQPVQMLPEYVGFTPFHQQGQQRPLDSSQAHPSLSLSLERPDMYGTMYSQPYQESPVPPPFARGTFDRHGGGSSRTFDLEQQPFQHAEQPNPGSYNVNSGNVQGNAYNVQGAAYHVQGETYQTHKGIESEDGFGVHHEAYQTHQGKEPGAHTASAPQGDGSLEQDGDGTQLQLVPASAYPPHEHGGHQQYYPLASATHDAVVQDPELFMTTLDNFLAALGTRLTVPKVEGLELNLHSFYCEVTARGGFVQVIRLAQWKELSEHLGISKLSFSTPYVLRKHYTSLLFHYEQVYYFRAEGQLVTPPVPLPAPSAVEPVPEVESPYEAPAELLSTLKKRKRKLDPMQVFGVDPAASIGTVVTGAINGKSDEGYYVTVVVGTEKLSGVLYHVSTDSDNHQFAKIPSLLDGIGSEENTAGLEVQLYGKQRREPIRKRNPNAPKRTRTGYNIYFKEQREKLKLLYPESKGLGKKVIEMWGKLPETEKSLYNARGNQEREKYLIEYREQMKSQPQVVETAGDAGSSEQPVGEHDHGAYYVSHDYHVSLEPESDLQSEHPQLSDMDQVYHAYHANGPQSHPPDSEIPGDPLISEQAYEMQEDEGAYNQEPGSDEDEEDAELEEAYEGEEDETAYPSEKGYEEHDGNEYQVTEKKYSTQEGMYPFPQNEAVVQEPRTHDASLTPKQPYYGQDHAYMYAPTLPPQMVGSQGTVHMKSMGQSPYQMQDNGKVIYPHLKPGHAEASGDAMVSQQHYLTQGRYAYATVKGGQEALGLPTPQEQAAFHRQDETASYSAPFHQNQGVASGIQTRQVPPEQAYQERYAYPIHFPHAQMYARPSPQGYPVRFPHSPYPMPWSESQAMQYGHVYAPQIHQPQAPQIHQPQASVPEVSGVVSASQVYQAQDGGHAYQA